MNRVIELNKYKNKKNKNIIEDISEFMKEQELYDRFYDYEGQDIYDTIISGEKVSKEVLDRWHCENEKEFLETWRGNSDEEYKKWLLENDYSI
jgi:hypothetical protein